MVLGSYERFVGKPRRERDRQYWEIFDKGYEEGLRGVLAECADWNRRRMERGAQGERFDEPFPGSREADEMLKTSERKRDSAKERTWLERLRRHWIWPHLVILFLVCVVIDLVALGYGIVWLVKYVAGIEGSGTVFWVTTGSLLTLGAYCCLYKFIRWWFR